MRRPPRLPLAILRALASPHHRDAIEGDLLEGYARRVESIGERAARRWLWSQLLSPDALRLRASARARRPFRTGAAMSRSRDRLAHRFDVVRRNLGWAVRSLRRRAAASAIIVATLAIAVGATTAIFTVVDRVLLRSLPYAEPDQLAMVFRTVPRFGFDRSTASYPDFADWREQTTAFAGLAAYGYVTRTRQADDGARRWVGYRFTADLLPLLGVSPALGRGFSPEDDRAGAPPVVILSHRLFTERFGADPAVLQSTVTLDGQPATVIGVMPEWFAFPGRTAEFWEPLRADAGLERSFNFLTVIGRLAPGETVETAQAELANLAARIDGSAEDANEGYGVFVEDRHAFEVRNARAALWVFMGAVALLLLVACANIANLQLSRTLGRRQEIGVRSALGAGQGRLATQLLTESLVLAAAGGALGVAVAAGLLDVLVALAPPGIPRIAEIGLDLRVLGFAAAASIAAGISFGVIPALWGARQDAAGLVRESGGSGRSRWAVRLQRGFAAGQIAIAITLSIGAGLLLHSFRQLTSVDPGFDPSGVVAARVPAPAVREPEPPPDADALSEEELMAIMMPGLEAAAARRIAFFDELVDRVGAAPGVESVGYAYDMPFGEAGFSRYAAPDDSDPAEEMPTVAGNLVSPDYFDAIRVPLREGRSFDAGDTGSAPDVAVVNEALAERFWPGESAVGKRLLIGEQRSALEVIGVVANNRQRSLDDPEPPLYYRPVAQASWPDELFLVVRSTAAAGDIAAVIRREVTAMDSSLPVTGVATAASMIEATIAAPRFRTLVLTTFGVIALLVAVLGVYGVISYSVSDRTREMGIRMALGAGKGNILGLVLRTGALMATAGIVIGLAGALALTRFIESMLFGVGARDALTFGVTIALALAVTLTACLIPARRASRVDPVESLRHE